MLLQHLKYGNAFWHKSNKIFFVGAAQQAINIWLTSTNKVDLENMLAKNVLFTHPADTEQQLLSFGPVHLASSLIFFIFSTRYLMPERPLPSSVWTWRSATVEISCDLTCKYCAYTVWDHRTEVMRQFFAVEPYNVHWNCLLLVKEKHPQLFT